jgi:hypothetical protein
VPPTQIAYNNAVTTDSNAPWVANTLTLKTLRSVLNRTNLPMDFVRPSPTGVAYVDDTYTWVKDNYTGTNPIHHLALLVAVIVSTSLLPYLYPPANARSILMNASDPKKVRKAYNDMEWTSRGTRGMTDKSIFVSMITTFIIAIYEPRSPLRVKMLVAPHKGLGDPWTKKYSASPFCFVYNFICLDCILFSGSKGLKQGLFVRLGLLWAKDTAGLDKGIFADRWGCYEPPVLINLHDRLISALDSNDPYVPFEALSILIGPKGATFFCKDILSFHYKL